MKKWYHLIGLVVTACVVVIALGEWGQRGNEYWKAEAERRGERVNYWKARYAESSAHVAHDGDTVRIRIARVDTLRDSIPVWRHDTTYIKEYVDRTEEALHACTDLANSCEAFRVAADSTIHAVTDDRDAYKRLAVSAEKRVARWKKVAVVGSITALFAGAYIRGQ